MDRQALETWLEEGLSLEQIGRRVGRHPSTVAYWVEKHGLTAAHRTRHVARGSIARDELESLVSRDLTIREIAAETERSPGTVRYWMTRYGLHTTDAARSRAGRYARKRFASARPTARRTSSSTATDRRAVRAAELLP